MSPKPPARREAPHRFEAAAVRLAHLCREFHARGWVFGTSGNFSAVVSRRPLRLAITASGADKSAITSDGFLLVDERGLTARQAGAHASNGRRGGPGHRDGRPSSETALHLAVVRAARAGSVMHTHSIWSTLLSDAVAAKGDLPVPGAAPPARPPAAGLALVGYEMLKGLAGVTTHEHREWLPVLENSQDMDALALEVEKALSRTPRPHGFLLRRHGLYTWGRDVEEAKRHAEILEFLLEVEGRRRAGW